MKISLIGLKLIVILLVLVIKTQLVLFFLKIFLHGFSQVFIIIFDYLGMDVMEN